MGFGTVVRPHSFVDFGTIEIVCLFVYCVCLLNFLPYAFFLTYLLLYLFTV